MMLRSACVAMLVLTVAVGCEKKPAPAADGVTQLPTRAPALGEFPDNPLLAYAPADTPYAFATFKPVPDAVYRKFLGLVQPVWRKAFGKMIGAGATTEQRIMKDVVEVLEHLDAKTIEDHGVSTKGRMVIYGQGAYPVIRAELLDGGKVFELVKLAAARWQLDLPAPIERAGGRYWVIDVPDGAALVALLPKQLVAAIGPRAMIDDNLAVLLAEQRPAAGLTTAQLRAVAERDGFTGQGVGYVDLARVGEMVAKRIEAPGCGAAIAGLARRVPRIAIGYDDFTPGRFAFGAVVELAPDVLGEARGLTGKLAGLDRLLASKPMIAGAVAFDLEHGRTTAGRAAQVLADLGQQCAAPNLTEAAGKAAAAMSRPLPPFLAGLHGGYVVIDRLKMGSRGPESVQGFASVQLDHAGDLLKLAAARFPGLDLPVDRKAHVLPSTLIPFPGHAAASDQMIGVAIGPGSEAASVAALQGTAAPAPLVVVSYDYARLIELIPDNANDPDFESVRDMLKAFGALTMQFVVDNRGLVWWSSLDFK